MLYFYSHPNFQKKKNSKKKMIIYKIPNNMSIEEKKNMKGRQFINDIIRS